MIIRICGKEFDSKTLNDITITSNEIMIDTEEDYFIFRYYSEEDIKEAKEFLKFKELTRKELLNAVNIIMITCDHFINEKEQCSACPLQKKNGCVFTNIPIEWR